MEKIRNIRKVIKSKPTIAESRPSRISFMEVWSMGTV